MNDIHREMIAGARARRMRGASLSALALAAALAFAPARAAETCGDDPAASINHTSNYILGEIGADPVAMHWPTGLVWKRCLEGQVWSIAGVCATNGNVPDGDKKTWSDWMNNHMPKAFSGQADRGIDGGLSADRLADGEWRLPYAEELHGLASGCAISLPSAVATMNMNVFAGMPSTATWSGSPKSDDAGRAHVVYFGNGQIYSASRDVEERARLVRGGQPFAAMAASVGQTVQPGAEATFGPITPTSASGSGVAWGGARIAGDASARFQVNGGAWVTEAIVKSGDTLAVRITAGAAGGARIATLTLRGAETVGTTADGANGGGESSVMRQAEFVFSVVAATAPATAVTALLPDPAAPGTVYGGVDGVGIHKTVDHGAHWTAATTQPTNNRIRALALEDGANLYAATYGGGVFKSADAGLNWVACPGQPGNLNLLSLARAANGTLFAGSEAGVFASADGCATWTAINNGLPD